MKNNIEEIIKEFNLLECPNKCSNGHQFLGYDENDNPDWGACDCCVRDNGYNPVIDKKTAEDFLRTALTEYKEGIKEEEIKYWTDIFDSRPKDRDLNSDTIVQNFARIEIERWEKK